MYYGLPVVQNDDILSFGVTIDIMKSYQFTARIERDSETGLYIGYIPNLPGAHTQGETLDELQQNLQEVAELVMENLTDEELAALESEFVGTHEVRVSIWEQDPIGFCQGIWKIIIRLRI